MPKRSPAATLAPRRAAAAAAWSLRVQACAEEAAAMLKWHDPALSRKESQLCCNLRTADQMLLQ